MRLPAILGPWGPPPDGPAWAALGVGVLLVAGAWSPAGEIAQTARVVARTLGKRGGLALGAFVAALLSLGYAAYYLRGGPRIIDATMYFLQGRALSEGHFAWHVPVPTANFRGRFLVAEAGDRIAGIFPPGYPLLLSLGFAIGAPMVIGPLLAAALVVATWALARDLAVEAGAGAEAARWVARTAGALSLLCATLRYHTADTMAHGACALAFTLALLTALRARRERLPWLFLLAGLPLGFVVATRFASALALGIVLVFLAVRAPRRERAPSLAACALGVLPGLFLLAVAQASVLGSPFASLQRAYYAASDGPPGCFAYGWGKGIGCLVEHGDFVRARSLAGNAGYGLLASLGVTSRRLRMHLEDVANLEPLALLIFAPLLRPASRTVGVRTALGLVGALVLAYAPFYFDGDYPGGGARFFADVLPVEHALLALGLLSFPRFHVSRLAGALLALACLGFAVHGAYSHEQLAARDGGRPMFEAEDVPRMGQPALVFVDTDHGFDLAHDPDAASEEAPGIVVARRRGDDHDRLLYEQLGSPATWHYRFEPPPPSAATTVADLVPPAANALRAGTLERWTPLPASGGATETWHFEAENEWPPLAQTGGAWSEPVWVTDTCASPADSGRALALHTTGDDGTVVIAVPIPRPGRWSVTPRFLVPDGATAEGIALELHARSEAPNALPGSGPLLAAWPRIAATPAGTPPQCFELAPLPVPSPAGPAAPRRASELDLVVRVEGNRGLEASRGRFPPALDRVLVTASSR